MIINYDVTKLNQVLSDFYNATGISIQLLKEDFSSFGLKVMHNDFCAVIHASEQGRNACSECDKVLLERCKESKSAQMHVCHAGLIDIAVPIIYEDQTIGYIILGQMKKGNDFSRILKNVSHLPVDEAKLKQSFLLRPVFDEDKIKSISNLSVMLAKHILLENMLKPDFNPNIEKATSFINENLEKDLSIEYITKNTHISKNVLYKNFRQCFDCTVSEYINRKRVEKSVDLLLNTNMSIEEISEKMGFSSATYYTQNFKKIKGTTPLKFRKSRK